MYKTTNELLIMKSLFDSCKRGHYAMERFIFIAITLVSLSTLMYIREKEIRKALLSFVTFQATTWLTSILMVQYGKIEYPVREFQTATAVNFVPQFIFYPTLFTWFILLFPTNRSLVIKIMHYILFVCIHHGMVHIFCRKIHRHQQVHGCDGPPNDYKRVSEELYAVCLMSFIYRLVL
ncbi:CBO0543 family protein [Paenibacillus silviterrae]|uniref:CBO0543 family protein n=1 Tax=Paenibacillus silviterrae TaxID=3242194 RepID=UPI00350E3655